VRALLWAYLVVASADPASFDDAFEPVDIAIPEPRTAAAILGVVRDSATSSPIPGAPMTLECADCLPRVFVQGYTDERGRYEFVDVPPGVYQVAVVAEHVSFAKIIEVPANIDFYCHFAFDPGQFAIDLETTSGFYMVYDTLAGEWRWLYSIPSADRRCDYWCWRIRQIDRRNDRQYHREQRREQRRERRR
jgi:hypothetical protein